MSKVLEIDATTGTAQERSFTDKEKAQKASDLMQAEQLQAAFDAEEKAASEAKSAAIAHAKSLGFTDAMIAVMYPNLGAQSD